MPHVQTARHEQVEVKVERTPTAAVVRWPSGLSLRFALEGDRVLGLREVQRESLPLRNPARLWRPRITTPTGVCYHWLEWQSLEQEPDGTVRLHLIAHGEPGPIQEEIDEYLGDVIDLTQGDEATRDALTWEFRPSRRTIDGHTLEGFAYRYRFTSDRHAIYRLFDHATWEIGGTLADNTLVSQGQCNPPVVPLSHDLDFTTACNYYGAEMKGVTGVPKRVSFQRLPRIGTLQAFDMIAHERGALIGLFEPAEEIFSVLQTRKGENYLHVVDEHRRPMSHDFQTHWKHMLFYQPFDRPSGSQWCEADRQNLWCRVHDHVHEAARERHGIERSPVKPRIWLPQVATDHARMLGRTFPRERFLYELADEAVPEWAQMGVREICAFSLWSSDYTEDRFARKQDRKNPLHGYLLVSSICSVREHVIDPLWGGPEALAHFVEKAHQHDIEVQLWFATHLSRRAPIFQQRPEFMLTARDGLPNGGGFGHQTIISLDLNNPDCFEYLYQKLKAVHDATGIDGFFHDSYGNMTFLPTNFADSERRGQQDAYERLVAKLQRAGMRRFTAEGIGPFGVGHFGMALLGDRNYQNALDWWIGHEDMMYGLNMGINAPVWPERESEARRFSFRCIAHGGRFGFTQTKQGINRWDGWVRGHNQLLAALGPLMGRRTVLPDDRGVQWHQPDGTQVLFSFKTHDHPLESPHRIVGYDDLARPVLDDVGEGVTAETGRVYHLTPANE